MRYTIGEMAEIIDGDRGKNYPQQHEFLDEGYCLFLNTGNVTKAGFSFDSNQFISKEKCDLLRKGKLQRHDIVYTTRGTVGNAAFYSDSIPYEHVYKFRYGNNSAERNDCMHRVLVSDSKK